MIIYIMKFVLHIEIHNCESRMEVGGMKIIKLLAALAVLSLLVAPALSEHIAKSCACMSGGGCSSSHAMNCSGKCSDSYYSQEYTCSCQTYTLFPNVGAVDPEYSYLGQIRSRTYGQDHPLISSSSSGGGSTHPSLSQANPDGSGPPDLDVIAYLPPSAKQVFNILVSNGPLTQKDLISKTELPPRTVRYALGRLKEECVIRECFYFPDARQSLYRLNIAAFRDERM